MYIIQKHVDKCNVLVNALSSTYICITKNTTLSILKCLLCFSHTDAVKPTTRCVKKVKVMCTYREAQAILVLPGG